MIARIAALLAAVACLEAGRARADDTIVVLAIGPCAAFIDEAELAQRLALEAHVVVVPRGSDPRAIEITLGDEPCGAAVRVRVAAMSRRPEIPVTGAEIAALEIDLGPFPAALHTRLVALCAADLLRSVAHEEEPVPLTADAAPGRSAVPPPPTSEPSAGLDEPATAARLRSWWRFIVRAGARHFPHTVASSIGGALALTLRVPDLPFVQLELDAGGSWLWTDDSTEHGSLEGGAALFAPIEIAPRAFSIELGVRVGVAYLWMTRSEQPFGREPGTMALLSGIVRTVVELAPFSLLLDLEVGGATAYQTLLTSPGAPAPTELWPHVEGVFTRVSAGFAIE